LRFAAIVGAGFNADAGPEVGTIQRQSTYGPFEFEESYPLVQELTDLCFPEGLPPGSDSIEDAMAKAIAEKRYEPLRRLCSKLRRADHYLVPSLLPATGGPKSRYARFFESFEDVEFISFNYDSFVEAFLFRSGQWYPHDGYGPPVLVSASYKVGNDFAPSGRSRCHVYHMHGSLNVCESGWTATSPNAAGIRWLKRKPDTEFLFEPGSNADLFFPWTSPPRPVTGFDPVEARVIAPVPNKAVGLTRKFVVRARNDAVEAIRKAECILSIGYEFSPADRGTYAPLLDELTAPILVICPNASSICDRLRADYARVSWVPLCSTFADWAEAGFPLDGTRPG